MCANRVFGCVLLWAAWSIAQHCDAQQYADKGRVSVTLPSGATVYVNGKRITAPQVVRDSDKIQVGDFVIQLAGATSKKKEKPKKPAAKKKVSKCIA